MNNSFTNLNNIIKDVEVERTLSIENVEYFMNVNEKRLENFMEERGILIESSDPPEVNTDGYIKRVVDWLDKLGKSTSINSVHEVVKWGLGATAIALLAYGIYKYVTDNAKTKKNVKLNDAKMLGERAALTALKQGIRSCSQSGDPSDCRAKYRKVIQKHTSRLRKLAGWKKDGRSK